MINLGLHFNNQFAQLPPDFYSKLPIRKVKTASSLVHFNEAGCRLIGLDPHHFSYDDSIQALSGNQAIDGSDPLSMVYSGHQFGIWAGQLGDGRALLLGQIAHHNQLWDLQLKGSGLTPYSRMGDGLAVMRSSIREYLCAEAMHALGIASTRSLCLMATHQPVYREKKEPGAVLARIAQTHIRFGHFEHFYYHQQWEHLKLLADHTITHYFTQANQPAPDYGQWFLEIVKRTAHMIAGWMSVGFCHGVMNTDNMSITGLTIDYGPFGFLEAFNPNHICNHSDEGGRYAYNQQPAIALWNLQALAHALQPILPLEESQSILDQYPTFFTQNYDVLMRKKLGFDEPMDESANQLWNDLLVLLRQTQADYSMVFNHLADSLTDCTKWGELFGASTSFQAHAHQWHQQFTQAHHLSHNSNSSQIHSLKMKLMSANPTYVLRNWVAEAAIRQAEDEQDYSLIDEVLHCVQNPFDKQRQTTFPYEQLAPPAWQNLTLSCSS